MLLVTLIVDITAMLLRALKSLLCALPLLLGIIFTMYLVVGHGQRLAIDGYAPLAGLGSRLMVAGLILWLALVVIWLRRREAKKAATGAVVSNDVIEEPSMREQLLRERLHAWHQRADSKLPRFLLVGPAGFNTGPLQGLSNANEGDLRCSAIGGFALYDFNGELLSQRQPEEARLWRLALNELQQRSVAGRPVRGVVLFLDAGLLQRMESVERDQFALTLRIRLEELASYFGKGLSVQLIVSGCEQLPGYNASLVCLDPDQRELSIEFPPASSNRQLLSTLVLRMNELIASLQSGLYERLQREPDVQVRGMLFGFSPMWRTFSLTLQEVLQTAFGQERGVAQVTLQSMRFIPLSADADACAPAPALLRALQSCRKGGRFRIFLRQGLTWSRPRVHYLLLAVCVLVSLMLLHLHRDQSRRLEQVDRQIDALQHRTGPVNTGELNSAALLRLDRLAEIERLVDQRWLPWASDRELRRHASQLYRQGLHQLLLTDVLQRLHADLRAKSVGDEHTLRRSLGFYLMLGGEGRFSAQGLRDWYIDALRLHSASGFSESQYQHIDNHLARLLKQLMAAPLPLERKLVEHVRDRLAVQPFAQHLYQQLLGQLSKYSLADFSAVSVLGAQGLLLFSRRSGELSTLGVPGHFSVVGEQRLHQLLDPLLKAELERERQLMGRAQLLEAAPLKQEILALYYQSYIDNWQVFFDDLQIVGLDQGEHLPRRMLQLAQKNSPLLVLLREAGRQTELAPAIKSQGWLVLAQEQSERLKHIALAEGKLYSPEEPQLNPVNQYFRPLHQWLAVTEQSSASHDLLSLLKSTAQFIQAEQSASQLKVRLPVNDVLQHLQAEVEQLPVQLQPLLQDVLMISHHWLQQRNSQSTQAAWNSEVEPFCKQALNGRYPFADNTSNQVAMDDFNRFFAADGMLQGFVDEYLSARTETASRSWQQSSAAADGMLGSQLLATVEQASQLRQSFFFGGKNLAGFEFEVSPLTMSERIAEFSLSLDSKRLNYTHGPLQATLFAWPGKALGGEVRASVTMLDGRTLTRKAEGPWAWFLLLDQARLLPTEDPQVRHLVLDFEGNEVSLKLRAGHAGAPFNRLEWSRFQCLNERASPRVTEVQLGQVSYKPR